MSMSVYRVNSAYLRTASVNRQRNNKSKAENNVSFGKGNPKKIGHFLDKVISTICGHLNENTPQPKPVLRDDIWFRRQFHGQGTRSNNGE